LTKYSFFSYFLDIFSFLCQLNFKSALSYLCRKDKFSILSSFKIIQKEDSMAKQLHKRFSTEEVKMLLQKYLEDKKKLPYILRTLQITKRRFFPSSSRIQGKP